MSNLAELLRQRSLPGGYNTNPGVGFNPRTLGGVKPVQPLSGSSGALKSRQMMQQGNSPIYQEINQTPTPQYFGKAGGGAGVAAGIGFGLKGIANVMTSIENIKALKLQQQRYQELYELSIEEKNHQMQMEAADKILQFQKMEQEEQKTVQSFMDNFYTNMGNLPADAQGGYAQSQLSSASSLYGKESPQVKALKAAMLANPEDVTETKTIDWGSIFGDIGSKSKAEGKATKEGQLEAEQENWKAGGREMFAEQEDIRAQKAAAHKQAEKSQEEREKEEIDLKKAKADLAKKMSDLENEDIEMASKVYLASPAIAFSLQTKSKDPGAMADEIGQIAKAIRKAKVRANPQRQQVFEQIASYGDKQTAITAISAKNLSSEAKNEALKMVDIIPWETLNPKPQPETPTP